MKSYVTPEYRKAIAEVWAKVQREMAEEDRKRFERIAKAVEKRS